MLRIDARELKRGPVPTEGSLAPADPLFHGLDVVLAEPLQVDGVLEATGRGDFFWRGSLAGRVRTVCRRCLTEMTVPVVAAVEALFTTNADMQDDPSVYPLVEPVTHVDVSGAVREELALAAQPYPLCREDCAGLCPHCGADLNQGPCGCPAPAPH